MNARSEDDLQPTLDGNSSANKDLTQTNPPAPESATDATLCKSIPPDTQPYVEPADADVTLIGKSATANDKPASAEGDVPSVPGYQIVSELGRGGMGVVYKAEQLALNRVVALKMILDASYAGPEQRERFRTEAETIARLQHPHIVQIFDWGEHAGRCYFALEFVAGSDLVAKLAESLLQPKEAAALTEVLARAIHTAHLRGIVHRDLKPANVLLAADGTPKITDFGLAKELGGQSNQTASGAILGTPSYMAPEQAEGHIDQISPATDVYALGAMLYEMLTGRPPFKGATALDTVKQVVSQEPVAPSQLVKLPRDLETICLKCLQKAPPHRYGSALELAEDLRRFQSGETILARPASPWWRLWKWAERRPARAFIAVLGGVAVLRIVASMWWSANVLHDAQAQAQRAEARVRHQGQVIVEQRQELRQTYRQLGEELIRRGNHAGFAKLMDKHLALGPDDGANLYELAGTYARAAELCPKEASNEAATYGDRSLEMLRRAQSVGYFHDQTHTEQLRRDQALQSVRERADFNELVRQLPNPAK